MAMLLLIALAAAGAPPRTPPIVEAAATVRIERSVHVDRASWERVPESSRSEKLTRDEQGRLTILRLIENP